MSVASEVPGLHSVRARLALWYAGAFALLLGAFAVGAYVFLSHTSLARVDESLTETAQTVADAVAFGARAGQGLADVLTEFRPREVAIVALDRATGAIVSASHAPGPHQRAGPVPGDGLTALLRGASPRRPEYVTVAGPTGPSRVVTLPAVVHGRLVVFAAAQSLAARERMLREAEAALAIGLPLMLAFATVGGYWLARKSLLPVTAMAAQADRIGATTLHERLPVPNARDELGRLATVFNRLLARLDDAFDRQRRFAADASHELRTPVTIIAGEAELALARERPVAELRDALDVVRREARRLAAVVDDLFLLARADGGDRQIARAELYLNDVAADAVRAMRSVALARGVELVYTGAAADMPYRGDEALLLRLLTNLLDNAVKYTPRGGRVELTTTRRDGTFVLAVRDTGPGVPEEARAFLFDRFFRARHDAVGVGDTTGAGLGLAIARWVAEAHGGTLVLAETGQGGSTFVATLPVEGDGEHERRTPTANVDDEPQPRARHEARGPREPAATAPDGRGR